MATNICHMMKYRLKIQESIKIRKYLKENHEYSSILEMKVIKKQQSSTTLNNVAKAKSEASCHQHCHEHCHEH